MKLEPVILQAAEPEKHYGPIANLMNKELSEPYTADSLADWHRRQLADGIQFTVASTASGAVPGFTCLFRSNKNIEGFYRFFLVVDEAFRRQGLGSRLYEDLLLQASGMKARILCTRVRDTSEEDLHFARKRGFEILKHSVEMMFDLKSWDDKRYTPTIQELQAQGFHFTSMAELGDTLEARQKLFALNNSVSATDPGSDGIPPWATFEEFNRKVCGSNWYRPDGQIVAIDTKTGEWAAMSAITVFAGADHAYNLFTGTDVRYRGRKLAQAVKSLALRRARTYGVDKVCTSHDSENPAMIAIDQKLGYVFTPGTYLMQKELG